MKKLILCGLSVFALASCGGDDDNAVTPQPKEPRMLTVVVSENPLQDENASAREALRRTAAATTTASLSHFFLNYENNPQEFNKGGSTWETGTWPQDVGDDTSITFYANDGGTFNWVSDDPYVSFTMDEDAFNQKDLLVATTETYKSEHAGQVYLTFDHACAAVQFYVYKEESADYVVKSIKLKNVKNTGDYHYSSNSWNDLRKTKKDQPTEDEILYTLTNGNINVSSEHQLLPCQWLFIIPQSKEGLTLEVTYTKGGELKPTKSLTLGTGSWEAGKKYTVNIRIGGKAAS